MEGVAGCLAGLALVEFQAGGWKGVMIMNRKHCQLGEGVMGGLGELTACRQQYASMRRRQGRKFVLAAAVTQGSSSAQSPKICRERLRAAGRLRRGPSSGSGMPTRRHLQRANTKQGGTRLRFAAPGSASSC